MKHAAADDVASDPFGERRARPLRTRARVLGGVFDFVSNSSRLLRLAKAAYDGLPPHAFCAAPPQFHLQLIATADEAPLIGDDVPRLTLHAGAGLLGGTMDRANFAMVSPRERSGLVTVSRNMLRRHPYHVRYELIEFAVYTMASRAQALISLHAACIGRNGRGLLLIGPSGAGKSTLSLHCLMQDMALVGEDAVLAAPDTLLATGVGSFLHLSAESLSFLRDARAERWIRASPVIRRRSGVEKFEVDLRRGRYRIARTPLEIASVVFLSKQRALRRGGRRSLLAPLRKTELMERLRVSQPYAANQPGWATFCRRISRVSAFELRRGPHPDEAVEALREIVG